MKDIILKHIIDEYGNHGINGQRVKHYSYCKFPEEECECRDLNDITYDTQLISGGYIDSFSMVYTLVFIERTFDIQIKDEDANPSNFNSVNNIFALAQRYIDKK